MADTKTSFVQFTYCSMCRLSHKRGKKHVYSKRHKLIVNKILHKFSSKISSIRKNLFNPEVEDASFEVGAKFWCYFCGQDYDKHERVEDCIVIGGGLLAHIVLDSHAEHLTQFFWDNLIDKKLKPQFILTASDLHIFQKASFLAVKKWQKAQFVEMKQIASCIEAKEEERLGLLEGRYEHKSDSSVQGTIRGTYDGNQSTAIGSGSIRKTVSAIAPGLTCILKNKEEDMVEGNVHTGARPPWLRPDTSSNKSQEIGPSMKDLDIHLEMEKRAKLPKNRVGANFDRSDPASAEWLPSFGRVWSKGRRLQSKLNFEKELRQSGKQMSKSSTYNGRQSSAGRQDLPAETAATDIVSTQNTSYEGLNNRPLYESSRKGQTQQIKGYESSTHGQWNNSQGSVHGRSNNNRGRQTERQDDFYNKWNANEDSYSAYQNHNTEHQYVQPAGPSSTYVPNSQQPSGQGQDWSSSDNLLPSSTQVRTAVRPYKRARTLTNGGAQYQRSSANQIIAQSSHDQNGHLSLIQTPVLALHD